MASSEVDHNGDRVLPEGSAILHAASDQETRRYYFPVPWSDYDGGWFSTIAPNAEVAKQSMADEYPGVSPDELPEPSLTAEEAEERDGSDFDWPDLHERDIWHLTYDSRPRGEQKWHQNHKRPTKTTIERIVTHWESVEEIPLAKPAQLTEAHGIGPVRAQRFAGAAAAEGLVSRVEHERTEGSK